MTFYVYQLVDPRDGLPFYVGKGQGNRAWVHQREVERGVVGRTSRKVDRIRQILVSGQDVVVQILADYDSEEDALDHEWRLIRSMPTLTNIIEGGSAQSLSPKQLAKRRRIVYERTASERAEAREAAEARLREQRLESFGVDAMTERDQAAVKDWLFSTCAVQGLSLKPKIKSSRPKNRPTKADDGLTHGQRRKLKLQRAADAMLKGR